jgi:hypothetical protein
VSVSSIQKRLRARKQRLRRRLRKDKHPEKDGPMLGASNIHYELADRTIATNYGGIVRSFGIATSTSMSPRLSPFGRSKRRLPTF